MSNIIVVARADGRGGCKPFGTYSKEQAGSMVTIGAKDYKVTSDGRVNIPKSIMEEYGRKGTDGRNRIEIHFATESGKDYWKNVKTQIGKPVERYKDAKTGMPVKRLTEKREEILTAVGGDTYAWGT